MQISDYELSLKVLDVYNEIIPTVNVAGIDYAVIEIEDGVVDIITEGTHDLEDAERDLDAFLIDVKWGAVHEGAYKGIPEAVEAIKARLDGGKRARCSGHSLGAMRAYYVGQGLHAAGYDIADIITWGCPLFGDELAISYFDKNGISNKSYRNYKGLLNHDLFTTIPIRLIGVPYTFPPNRIERWSAPTATNEFKGKGVMIEAHSFEDCYVPLTKGLYDAQQ